MKKVFVFFFFGSFSVFFPILFFLCFFPIFFLLCGFYSASSMMLYSFSPSLQCQLCQSACHYATTPHPLQCTQLLHFPTQEQPSLPLRWAEKSLQLPLGCWELHFPPLKVGCLGLLGFSWPPSTKHPASFQPLSHLLWLYSLRLDLCSDFSPMGLLKVSPSTSWALLVYFLLGLSPFFAFPVDSIVSTGVVSEVGTIGVLIGVVPSKEGRKGPAQ